MRWRTRWVTGRIRRCGRWRSIGQRLGYDLEHFWANEAGMTPERLRGILAARGVTGVLLPPPAPGRERVELEWRGLAVVSFGCSRVEPRLHSIHCHHYRAMETLLAELWALGYRRPGLALTKSVNASVDGAWLAAYLKFGYEASGRLPKPLIDDDWGAAELLAWREAQRVDVVVTERIEALGWLRAAGVGVPDECGFAMTARHLEHALCAGIDENSAVIGVTAVELLTSLVERGEFGVPNNPQNVLIEGGWSPLGRTVRRAIQA